MPDPTPPDIVVAVAEWLAARAGLSLDATPRPVWAHAIDEAEDAANVADPASVIRAYPGGQPSATVPLHHALLQTYTVASTPAAAYRRATLLFEMLADDNGENAGLPAIGEVANVFKFNVTARRAPGAIGRDAKGRTEVVFNFEVHYTRQ